MMDSRFVEIEFEGHDAIDMQVRVTSRSGKKTVYLGRGSSVITFPLNKLDNFIEFLKQARNLKE